ncbi:MAG: dihydrofolate reductase family protein, partial [Geodermatophilales bacterium]|nr:dihydrofolate reductase family protein [Geodermatophilales bacterium]
VLRDAVEERGELVVLAALLVRPEGGEDVIRPPAEQQGVRALVGGEDNEIATLFNSVPKYVASRGRPDLSWAGSTQLGPDLAGAVREIRNRHEHVKVVGSLNLVQTLLREKLFDRLDLWVHPIVLGVGKKVFDGGAVPTNVRLLEPPLAGPKGTVYLRYGLADGTPGTGDMSAPDRGAGRDD